MLEKFIKQVSANQPLTTEQAGVAVEQLIDEAVPSATKAEFLTELARKGETVEEIAAFARELRAKSVVPELDAETRAREILDIVGTGGDRLGTFNISTTAAIICAAAGVMVAKHGNRAATSQCGSADVLEALGVPIHLSPEQAAESLRERGFAFFFAPDYHPAFKHVAAARKLCAERGQRTIFNFLGPLLNPARPSAMLVGVPRPELCEPLAHVLQSLGVRLGMVVCGEVAPLRKFAPFEFERGNRLQQVRVLDVRGHAQILSVDSAISLAESQGSFLVEVAPKANPPVCALVSKAELDRVKLEKPGNRTYLDELSNLGDNTVAEFYQERGFSSSVLTLEPFPLQFASLADLLGGSRDVNVQIVNRLLQGEERGPKRDAVLLNAAAALMVAGRARTMMDGWDLAAEAIDSGAGLAKLKELAAR